MKKNVTYKIPGKECSKVYVGQTKRKLESRIKEHSCSCIKTEANGEVKEDERNDTRLPLHFLQSGHRFNFDAVEILKQDLHWLLEEAMYLSLTSDTCNIQSGKEFCEIGWMH